MSHERSMAVGCTSTTLLSSECFCLDYVVLYRKLGLVLETVNKASHAKLVQTGI